MAAWVIEPLARKPELFSTFAGEPCPDTSGEANLCRWDSNMITMYTPQGYGSSLVSCVAGGVANIDVRGGVAENDSADALRVEGAGTTGRGFFPPL